MGGRLILPAALGGIWMALSGVYSPLLLALGAASVAVVVVLARRMDRVDGARPVIRLQPGRVLGYVAWLAREVVLANLDVVRRVVSPKRPISPTVVRVHAHQRSDLAKVIFANSITLTPGTVTLAVGDEHVEVHALSREAAQALGEGEMDRRVCSLEVRE